MHIIPSFDMRSGQRAFNAPAVKESIAGCS
jgi:hypothetical protein